MSNKWSIFFWEAATVICGAGGAIYGIVGDFERSIGLWVLASFFRITVIKEKMEADKEE